VNRGGDTTAALAGAGVAEKARSDGALETETHRAIRNAGILTVSLLGTWTIALGVRLLLPRLLGPTAFGALHFADYFAQGFFVVTALGVDTYIRKEIATRPEHASDFFGGVLVLRVLAGLVLAGIMALVLGLTGHSSDVWNIVFLYAGAHFLLTLNQSYGALLQARGEVSGLALVNFVTKVGWGGAVVTGLAMKMPLYVVPAAFIAAELVKTAALVVLSRRHLALRIRVDRRATTAVVVASLPFFLNILAQQLYDKVDVSMIGIMAGHTEAGYYGAASVLTAVALMLTPIISSVILPHSSLAAARSAQALQAVMEGALRVTLTIILPVAMVLILGAELWVGVLFGAEFAPSIPALQIRATSLVLTYMATLSAIHLIQLGRLWTVTLISFTALSLNPITNYFLIDLGARHLGPGGAGTGAAIASLSTELVVVGLMQVAAGRQAIVRAIGPKILRSAATVAVTAAGYVMLEAMGPWRLLVVGLAWLPAGLALGAIDRQDLATLWKAIFARARGR
jgi:O-antigen/teichoic acid export membrane protein